MWKFLFVFPYPSIHEQERRQEEGPLNRTPLTPSEPQRHLDVTPYEVFFKNLKFYPLQQILTPPLERNDLSTNSFRLLYRRKNTHTVCSKFIQQCIDDSHIVSVNHLKNSFLWVLTRSSHIQIFRWVQILDDHLL